MNINTLVRRAQKLADSITADMAEADIAEIEARHAELLEQIEFERNLQPEEGRLGLPSKGSNVNRRAALWQALCDAEAPATNSTVAAHASSHDRRAAITSALVHRVLPGQPLLSGAERYAGLALPEIARTLLSEHQRADGLSPAEALTRAFHTTSDFPIIMGDVAHAVMRAGYAAAPAAIKAIAKQSTARNFKAKASIQLSAGPKLELVNEHGEFKRGSLSEGKESYKVATFGKVFAITRQALVNDDIGAFDAIGAILGAASAEFEADFLVKLLESNPAMTDGKAVFHVDHANLATAAALSVDALSAARLALRTQRGLAGEPIAVAPKFLVVPAALETKAEQVLATLAAATVDDVNPFSQRLSLIVEPRLADAKAWYVAADPAAVPSIEYSYLEGASGPQIDSRHGFDVDGLETRVRLDFGAGFLDHRGVVKNPGV